MDLNEASVVVTGGASGLGLATATRLANRGAAVAILDLPTSAGPERAEELGPKAFFTPADVTDPEQVRAAMQAAADRAPLRLLVHCAGRGANLRVLDRDDKPGDLALFESIVRLNLIGTFNVLTQAASFMARNEPEGDDRGAIVLTASVAAWEGQIGQMPYTASKAGIVGMTLNAARDLAKRQIRVNSIAPGIFDTPILDRHPQSVKDAIAATIPHPSRMGRPDEFAMLVEQLADNSMINGETIRLDGAIRMQPK